MEKYTSPGEAPKSKLEQAKEIVKKIGMFAPFAMLASCSSDSYDSQTGKFDESVLQKEKSMEKVITISPEEVSKIYDLALEKSINYLDTIEKENGGSEVEWMRVVADKETGTVNIEAGSNAMENGSVTESTSEEISAYKDGVLGKYLNYGNDEVKKEYDEAVDMNMLGKQVSMEKELYEYLYIRGALHEASYRNFESDFNTKEEMAKKMEITKRVQDLVAKTLKNIQNNK